jgi:hypothetical protein
MSLSAILDDSTKRSAVIADCGHLLEAEVASKRGLRARALKTGFKAFKRLSPGIVSSAFGSLLPAFAPAVDPFYARGCASGDVHQYFRDQRGPIADALLAVTDDKATRAKNRVMVKIYTALRRPARDHVMAAVPRISELIVRHEP